MSIYSIYITVSLCFFYLQMCVFLDKMDFYLIYYLRTYFALPANNLVISMACVYKSQNNDTYHSSNVYRVQCNWNGVESVRFRQTFLRLTKELSTFVVMWVFSTWIHLSCETYHCFVVFIQSSFTWLVCVLSFGRLRLFGWS